MKTAEALRHLQIEDNELPFNEVQGVVFLKNRPKLRAWAAANACSLLFILVLFVITWILFLLVSLR